MKTLIKFIFFSFLVAPLFSQVVVNEGQRVEMAGTADGSQPFTIQFYKKSTTDILIFTGQTYIISSASPADSGDYYIVVSNALGSTTSPITTLVVNPLPSSATAPSRIYIEVGEKKSFL